MIKTNLTALAMINNYICTERMHEADSTFKIVKELSSHHESWEFFEKNKPCDFFGQNWDQEDLAGKSIEIFCDHGLGDTIQMFRYIAALKDKYDGVKIVLNCLNSFPLQRLCDAQDFVDVFSQDHVLCDYHTNIMQLPKFYHGHFMWKNILDVPEQPLLEPFTDTTFDGTQFDFGLKYNSQMVNKLFQKKSIWPVNFIGCNYASLEPDADWQKSVDVGDIADLMSVMTTLPVIVSVDTMTLHLAGSMRLPTIGLLCCKADARWGQITDENDKTPWYPTVKLLRQETEEDWKKVVKLCVDMIG